MKTKKKITYLHILTITGVFLFFLCSASGCAPSIKKNCYNSADFSMLTIGSSSKKEVLECFGLPHKIIKSKDNNINKEFWIYLKESVTVRSACVPSITTFSGSGATSIFLHSPKMTFELDVPTANVLAYLQFDEFDTMIDLKIYNGVEK